MGWRTSVDVNEWILRFSDRRYGYNENLRLGWQMLLDSAYSPEGGSASNVVAYEPRLNQRGRASSLDAFGSIMELYLKAAAEMKELTPPFRHDFVDLAREFTADLIAEVNALLRSSLDRCITRGKEYIFVKDHDAPGNDIKRVGDCGMGHTNPCDKDVLMKACDETPECVGFNMNGFLKSNTDTISPSGRFASGLFPLAGCDVYYKEVFFNKEKCIDSTQALVEEIPELIKDLDTVLGTSVEMGLGGYL